MNEPADRPMRLVVGMSGSSAPQIGIALLEVLQGNPDIETHLVVSEGAARSIELEAGVDPDWVAGAGRPELRPP